MRRAPVLRSLTTKEEGKNSIEALLVLQNLEAKIKFCFMEGTHNTLGKQKDLEGAGSLEEPV